MNCLHNLTWLCQRCIRQRNVAEGGLIKSWKSSIPPPPPPCSLNFDNKLFIEATHRGEAESWDGETICSWVVGVRGGRGRVEAAGLQGILKPRGAQIAVRLAVSCFNKGHKPFACDQLWPDWLTRTVPYTHSYTDTDTGRHTWPAWKHTHLMTPKLRLKTYTNT